MSSALAAGVPCGARCHLMASIAHVEKNQGRSGVYTCMVHCKCACRTLDARSTPQTMSAASTSTTPVGAPTRPSAAWVVQGHFQLPCVGNAVHGVQDIHAAACGLVVDPAFCHAMVQRGAHGSIPCLEQCPMVSCGFFFYQFSPRLFYRTTLVTQWVLVEDVPFYVPTTFANGFSLSSVSVW